MDRYEEAMSRCKQWEREHTKGYVIQDMIEFIFPELAESEDERIRKELLSFIESVQHSYLCATDRRKKWIAYLEKQKEQQPAEWSEEDEQWLESIIKDYENSLTKDKDHAAVIKIKIDFLKSLRPKPHWKPTAMQMVALLRAVDDLQGKPYWGDINEVVYDIRDKLM